jgi:hypothetical protein
LLDKTASGRYKARETERETEQRRIDFIRNKGLLVVTAIFKAGITRFCPLEPRRGERRELSAGSYAPPGLRVLCWLRFPGLTPWAKLLCPSGANRTTKGDVGKIVIPDKV